jgi:hypothetical protein
MALMSKQIQNPYLAACNAGTLQTVVHVRLQHAQTLCIHPARLLAHFSIRETGVAVGSKLFARRSGELLIYGEESVTSLALGGGMMRKEVGGSRRHAKRAVKRAIASGKMSPTGSI